MDLGALDLVPSLENVKRVVGTSIEAAFICAAVGGGSGEWDKVSAEDMMSTFRVNVVGPVMCAQHLVPLLKEGEVYLFFGVLRFFSSSFFAQREAASACQCDFSNGVY
jgi:NAD(P)-dependent dehydrogenase (short-subunit alcohol dehydrogenase family)